MVNQMPTDHGFVGQVEDDSTGLDYLNNRYYDPTLGIFLSVDPLVAKTGTPYLYANGNPTTLSDPSGLCSINPFSDDDCYSEAVGAVVDAGADVVDAGVSVASGVYHRGATLVNYEFDSFVRRTSNPLQSMWDDFSGTTLIEQFSALETVAFDDARLYKQGPYCGREAECFTGSDAFGGKDATTTGHTIRFSAKIPLESTVAHEMQHVYDIESVGGAGFYVSYGGYHVGCMAMGGSSDGCYHSNPWEKRAYNITDNYPGVKPRGLFGQWSSSIWNWTTRHWVSPVGPVIGSSPQLGSSSAGSNSGGLRPKSGPY